MCRTAVEQSVSSGTVGFPDSNRFKKELYSTPVRLLLGPQPDPLKMELQKHLLFEESDHF